MPHHDAPTVWFYEGRLVRLRRQRNFFVGTTTVFFALFLFELFR